MKFLRYPIPFVDESLIGYIYRLSSINFCSDKWIFNKLKATNKNNLNLLVHTEYLDVLSPLINLTSEDIYNLTYYKYKFFSYITDPQKTKHNFINDLIERKHARYCPLCLKEEQYHRLHWNIKPLKICMKHKIYLIDRCHSCKELTNISQINSAICSCSTNLTETYYEICKDIEIINVQSEILSNLGIYFDNDTILSRDYINIKYINSLVKLVPYIVSKKDKLSRINKAYLKDENYEGDLYGLYILQSMKSNLPNSLELLLDDLNDIRNYDINNTDEYVYLDTDISPISVIQRHIDYLYDFFSKDQLLNDAIDNYIKNNYNISFFKNRLNKFIIDEKYLETRIAHQVFGLSLDTYSSVTQLYIINLRRYLHLENLVDFIYKHIQKYKILKKYDISDKHTVTVDELYSIFEKFGFTELEIINILEEEEDLNPVLHPNFYKCGFDIIKLPKNKCYSILLKKALEKIDETI